MSDDTTRITVDLDNDLHKQMKAHCLLDLDISMSEYIRELIKADLESSDAGSVSKE